MKLTYKRIPTSNLICYPYGFDCFFEFEVSDIEWKAKIEQLRKRQWGKQQKYFNTPKAQVLRDICYQTYISTQKYYTQIYVF